MVWRKPRAAARARHRQGGHQPERFHAGGCRNFRKENFPRLPPPEITDAYLDDSKSQVIDHTTGLLRAFDKDLEQAARANAVDDIRRAARDDGILDEADKRAKLELELFLRQAGFDSVEFR